MQSRVIHGKCRIHATALTTVKKGAAELVLDTKGLDIRFIKLLENVDGSPVTQTDVESEHPKQQEFKKTTDLKWKLSPPHPILGEALHVYCPALRKAGSKAVIWIEFKVNESSTAVQFLQPELTASKTHPFLFTQCQAIHARALCPCQVRSSCFVFADSDIQKAVHLGRWHNQIATCAGYTECKDDVHCESQCPCSAACLDECPGHLLPYWGLLYTIPLLTKADRCVHRCFSSRITLHRVAEYTAGMLKYHVRTTRGAGGHKQP